MGNGKNKKIIIRYTLVGIAFGFCFPIGASILELILKHKNLSLSNIQNIHQNNPLLFMIDSAPLFLGLFAMLGGINLAKSEYAKWSQTQIMLELEQQKTEHELLIKQQEKSILHHNQLMEILNETTYKLDHHKHTMNETMETLKNSGHITNEIIRFIHEQLFSVIETSQMIYTELNIYSQNIHETHDTFSQWETVISNNLTLSNTTSQTINNSKKHLEQFLSETENIMSSIKAIDKIVSQTTMLSLNASIEAARAGAHGKGFAIVAQEVVHLANSTKDTSINIAENTLRLNQNGTLISQSIQDIYEFSNDNRNGLLKIQTDFNNIYGHIDTIKTITKQLINQIHNQENKISDVEEKMKALLTIEQTMQVAIQTGNENLAFNEQLITRIKEVLA